MADSLREEVCEELLVVNRLGTSGLGVLLALPALMINDLGVCE